MSDPHLDAAIAVRDAWADAFARRDPAALAVLYSPRTAFYGSTATLHTDPAGVRAYFAALPARYKRARFAVPHVVSLGPDAVAASGEVVFVVEDGGQEREVPYRMTHVLLRRDGIWKIATHHASPRPATGTGPVPHS